MISGAVKMVSVWNKGTFPRIKELKDCKFLRGLIKKDTVLTRMKYIQQLMKMTRVTKPYVKGLHSRVVMDSLG